MSNVSSSILILYGLLKKKKCKDTAMIKYSSKCQIYSEIRSAIKIHAIKNDFFLQTKHRIKYIPYTYPI